MKKAKPIVKWAGGKRRLIPQYEPYFPPNELIRTYREPMVGGGAIFFHLASKPGGLRMAVLGDINHRLIKMYQGVRDAPEGVIHELQGHASQNSKEYYYTVRDEWDPDHLTPAGLAAWFIYLNKTCYNGLYRENKAGKFNMPYGYRDNPTICDEPAIYAASEALRGSVLAHESFEEIQFSARGFDINYPQYTDFVYFDPPYIPLNATSFVNYVGDGFGEDLQRALCDLFKMLTHRGVRAMLSQSAAQLSYELYGSTGYTIVEVQAPRSINRDATKRGPVDELLILNYVPGTFELVELQD